MDATEPFAYPLVIIRQLLCMGDTVTGADIDL